MTLIARVRGKELPDGAGGSGPPERAADVSAPDEDVVGDPCLDLLKQLEPAMQSALFAKE